LRVIFLAFSHFSALIFLAGDSSELGVLSGAGRLGGGFIVPSVLAVLATLAALAAPEPVKFSRSGGGVAATGVPNITGFGPLA